MAEYIEVTVLSDQIARIKRSVELNTEFMNSENSTYYLSALQNVEKAIATIPKADVVEVKHGRWIFINQAKSYLEPPCGDICECSLCGHKLDVSETNYNYCPNCGAKMDKE